jgi:hypothetical protein
MATPEVTVRPLWKAEVGTKAHTQVVALTVLLVHHRLGAVLAHCHRMA